MPMARFLVMKLYVRSGHKRYCWAYSACANILT